MSSIDTVTAAALSTAPVATKATRAPKSSVSRLAKAKKNRKAQASKKSPAKVVESIAPVVPAFPSNPLATRAVLIRLSIPTVPQYKRDDKATEQVCTDNNVTGGKSSARVQKTLLSGPEMNAVNSAAQRLRNAHLRVTAPWFASVGIVPAAKIADALRVINDAKRQYSEAVTSLADKVDTIKDGDKVRLGSLYNEGDYISRAVLMSKSEATVEVMPVSSDFRTGMIDDAIVAESRKAFESRINSAKVDLLTRLADKVRHSVSMIGAAHEKRFSNTVITNVIDTAAEVMAALFDGDERLVKLCDSLKAEFATLLPLVESIKDETVSTVREESKAKAQAALAQIEEAMNLFA